MNEMSGKASAADHAAPAAVEVFAARCAHDLNNLLTGILGNLELMQNRARRNGIHDFDGYLEGARNAAGRAAEFTQRLLVFSGQTAQEPVAVPVNALARDIVELMREQSVTVTADFAGGACEAFCDPAQLELALLELIANAREATAVSGAVTLRTRVEGDAVAISVCDTGAGMTAEVLARAAEPFYSTRSGGAGKGLGLALAANVARHAGGTIILESAPAQGTTVTLTLPRSVPA